MGLLPLGAAFFLYLDEFRVRRRATTRADCGMTGRHIAAAVRLTYTVEECDVRGRTISNGHADRVVVLVRCRYDIAARRGGEGEVPWSPGRYLASDRSARSSRQDHDYSGRLCALLGDDRGTKRGGAVERPGAASDAAVGIGRGGADRSGEVQATKAAAPQPPRVQLRWREHPSPRECPTA